MGLTISIMKLAPPWGFDHLEWDPGKYSGDREAAKLMLELPIEHCDLARNPADHGIDVFHRPTDFAAWRAARWPDVNAQRWQQLIDILEAEPDYWIHLSY